MNRPAIKPIVGWFVLMAHSHAAQSSSARRAVTPSGPNGIDLEASPRSGRHGDPTRNLRRRKPAAAATSPGARGAAAILSGRLAGEVLWLHRSLPSF